jgi:foldase protein PrsA
LLLVALILGLTALVACSAAAPPAATMGDTQVTDEQLAHEVNVFEFLSELNQKPCGTQEPGETEASACARLALSGVIAEHFAGEYAAAHDITVTDDDIKPELDNLDQQPGKDKVDEMLAAHDLTRADLTAIARRFLLLRQVQSSVTESRITDAELQDLYQQNILDYTTVQVDHILVETKAQADVVFAQVTAPGATQQDFQDLARQVSIDPSAKQSGGSLGSAVASGYVPSFGRAAAALEPGEISQPVHSKYGWHVIRMVDKQVTPYADAKQGLIGSMAPVEFNAWLRDQVTTQGVDVNPRYGRYDVELLQVTRISSTATGIDTTPSTSPSA